MKKRWILIAGVVVTVIAVLRFSGLLTAYEKPRYEVLAEEGDLELRRYGSFVVAETVAAGDYDEASSRAFRRLFAYITGRDREAGAGGEKIAMTVPVNMEPTADGWRMAFMMPSSYRFEELPPPADSRIALRRVEGGLIASLTYGGRSTAERFAARRQRLLDWVEERGLERAGEPIFAVYDGPFTPWFLRRNEVLVRIAGETADAAAQSAGSASRR